MSEWSKEMHLSCIAPLVRLGSNPSADNESQYVRVV
jgi:hypothetical protein